MANDNMIPNLRAVRNEADAAAVRAAPAVADEAALAGKPAGQYELTSTAELVAWNGAGVTARGPMPASARKVAPALMPLVDALTPRGATGSGAAVTAGLAAGAVQLGAASYDTAQTLTLREGAPLTGLGRRLSKIWGLPGLIPGQAIVQTTAEAKADDYRQAGQVLRGVEITSDQPNLIGLLVKGAYRTIEDISVHHLQGGIGILFGQTNTYCDTLRDGEVYGCDVGIKFPEGINNSGERVMVENYTVFNNNYNIFIQGGGWFLKFHNVSLDYASEAQIVTKGDPLELHFSQGHIEGHADVPFISSTAANAPDLGVVQLNGTTVVGTLGTATTFAQAAGNYLKGTIILRDCIEQPSGNRINKVLTHYTAFEGETPQVGKKYFNEAHAAMEVAAAVTMTGDANNSKSLVVFIGGDAQGNGGIEVNRFTIPAGASGDWQQTLRFRVPPRTQYFILAAGTPTFGAVRGEFLP